MVAKSIKEARALGINRYFTGRPCPRGHIAERTASKGECVKCRNEDAVAWKRANRAKVLGHRRKYRKKFPGRHRASCYKAHSKRALRVPPWVDHDAIAVIYDRAVVLSVTTGIPHEVDHIFPLLGKHCSGLHVPWNLRIIPAAKNRGKGNRLNLVRINKLMAIDLAKFDAAMEKLRQSTPPPILKQNTN